MRRLSVFASTSFLFVLVLCTSLCKAQTAGLDESVLFYAEVKDSPPSIKLRWSLSLACQGFHIYRKFKTGNSFIQIATGLSNQTSDWTDINVQPGVEYEYKIVRYGGQSQWTGSNGWGYISAGIKVNQPDFRGKIILLIDTNLLANASLEISIWQWKQDVEGDGWEVIMLPVSSTGTAFQVRQKIIQLSSQYQTVRAVFILGRVPVPYSGQISPDGHGDHDGAWPADGYYGDIDGTWTDVTVNSSSASDPRNRNIPDDGKFDQSTFPGEVDLEVGRVDFRNLPMFNLTEAALIKRYLTKNHKFRTHQIHIKDRPQHDDQVTGLNFGATAWRTYWAVSRNTDIPTNNYGNMCTGNFRNVLTNYDYLWSGSWGPGSYTSVGSNQATSFVSDSFRTVFTSFIGSYFGDWDSPSNNFMKAALGNKGPLLTTCWSGRPFWYFHNMGMGETIGYAAKLTMNNSSVYEPGSRARQVHIGLLGDPTLRMHPIGQVSNVQTLQQNERILVTWDAPNDTLLGYNVLRKVSGQSFQRLNTELISGTSFVDSCPARGQNIYMIRGSRLEGSKTGTYWNQGTGIMDTVLVQSGILLSVQIQNISGVVCATDTLKLRTQVQNSPQYIAYQWFKNDTLIVGAISDSLEIQQPSDGSRFKVRIISTSACGYLDTAFSAEKILDVSPTVYPGVQLSSPQFPGGVCQGRQTRFSARSFNGGLAPLFVWYLNSNPIMDQSDTIWISQNLNSYDTVQVKLTSSSACAVPKVVFSTPIVAVIHPNPTAQFLVDQTNLKALNPAGLHFQWMLNGLPIVGATDSSYAAVENGNYALIVTNVFNCLDTSISVFVSVLGITQTTKNSDYKCFPNPISHNLVVEWKAMTGGPDFLEITDAMGRTIHYKESTSTSGKQSLEINTQNWPPGNYFLRIWKGNSIIERFIVTK